MIIEIGSCRDRVIAAITGGSAVAVPGPAPLPYVIAARDRATLNAMKGRPLDQPAVVVISDLRGLASCLNLDAATLSFAEWISRTDLVHLTAPIIPGFDRRWNDAVDDGMLAFTLAWSDRLSFMLSEEHPVFASSANPTDGEPLADTDAVRDTFGDDLLIVRSDRADGENASVSSVMLTLGGDCDVRPLRDGFQTKGFASPEDYAARAIDRWRDAMEAAAAP